MTRRRVEICKGRLISDAYRKEAMDCDRKKDNFVAQNVLKELLQKNIRIRWQSEKILDWVIKL